MPSIAAAQEFRVYTTVRDVSAGQSAQPIVSRSLTLFRGGRSYDWLDDLGEVIVSDRVRGRSSVISRQLEGTHVERDQIAHYLKVGRTEATTYLTGVTEPSAREAIGFSLEPSLTAAFEPELERLVLSGGGWTYTIQTAEPPDTAIVEAYLDYADRAAAMNFLFHPRANFPALRQAANAELRKVGRVPVSVTLESAMQPELTLQAEHKYGWTLESFDRSRIRQWDLLLRPDSDKVRWMTLRSFQQQTVAAQ